MQVYTTLAITMKLYIMPIQLHRPDSVAAAVSETDSVTVSWRGRRRIHIFSQSCRLDKCARVVSILVKKSASSV